MLPHKFKIIPLIFFFLLTINIFAAEQAETVKVNIQNDTDDHLFIALWDNPRSPGQQIQLPPHSPTNPPASTYNLNNNFTYDFGLPLGGMYYQDEQPGLDPSQQHVIIDWNEGYNNSKTMKFTSLKGQGRNRTYVYRNYTVQSTYNPATKEIFIKILKK